MIFPKRQTTNYINQRIITHQHQLQVEYSGAIKKPQDDLMLPS